MRLDSILFFYNPRIGVPSEPHEDLFKFVFSALERVGQHRIRTCITQFYSGDSLGKGGFGTVVRVTHKRTMTNLALKILDKGFLVGKFEDRLVEEISIQGRLRHANILRMKGFWEEDFHVNILVQYAANGDLYKYLVKNGKVSERKTARFIYELSSALDYCHSNGIIHRDVKSEKSLLDSDLKLLVRSRLGQKRETVCGTPCYLAPEVLLQTPYDHRVDVWAVGVMTFEFVTGRPPFAYENADIFFQLITNCEFKYPKSLSSAAVGLIGDLVVLEPDERIGINDILSHTWMQNNGLAVKQQGDHPLGESQPDHLIDTGDKANEECEDDNVLCAVNANKAELENKKDPTIKEAVTNGPQKEKTQ